MLWNTVYALLLTLVIALLALLLHHRMHAAAPGDDTSLMVTVYARCEAPELEALLCDLLWLRREQVLRAKLRVVDDGLESEALVRVRTICGKLEIPFFERK